VRRNHRAGKENPATEQRKDELIAKLQEALENVKKLSGLIPICSHCKKIRNDEGYWKQIEDISPSIPRPGFLTASVLTAQKDLYRILKDIPEEK